MEWNCQVPFATFRGFERFGTNLRNPRRRWGVLNSFSGRSGGVFLDASGRGLCNTVSCPRGLLSGWGPQDLATSGFQS
eukprot:13371480-Alexandrium_andersonii.AAC.1